MTLDRPRPKHLAPRPSTPTERTNGPLRAAALLIGVVPFVVHAWATLDGFFAHDDFIIMYRAAQASPFDLGYLFQGYNNEHVAPGMFLLAWVVTSVAPLSYPAAVLPLLAMQAVALVLLWRLLVRCLGARWGILPPFAIVACSPLILVPTLWWAYAVQLLPLLLTMIGALGAHACYVRDGGRRHAVFAVLWTVAGMAFYEKAALFPGLLFGLTMLLAPDGTRSAVEWALRRHWRLWLAYAALVVGYAIAYLTITRTNVGGGEDLPAQFAEFARRLLIDTFVPGLLGGPLSGSAGGAAWAVPPLVVRVVAALLAATAVVIGLRIGGRRARLAWLVLAGYLAVDIVLVAATRLPLVGPIVGADPRYFADAVPVTALCTAFAFLPPRTAEAGAPAPRARAARPTQFAVIGLTLALVVVSMISFLRLAPSLQFRQSRDYVATARAGLAQDPRIVLYDGGVPNEVMLHWFAYDAKPSRVIGLLPGPPRFDIPTERLWALDSQGHPRPVNGLVDVVFGVPGPTPDCGYQVGLQRTTISLPAPSTGHVLRLEYRTEATGEATIDFGGRQVTVNFQRGTHFLHVVVDRPFQLVGVRRNGPADPVCIMAVQVGEPYVEL